MLKINKISSYTYAGIGSRETPPDILSKMTSIAVYLSAKGYLLRSGGAVGADTAFEQGAQPAQIFRPEHATEEALKLAKKYHPAWGRCNQYARKLHARNGMILLGSRLNSPVDFVVCWTPDGKASGGTGQALRIAKALDIQIINLF
jgi:hypothetical protein